MFSRGNFIEFQIYVFLFLLIHLFTSVYGNDLEADAGLTGKVIEKGTDSPMAYVNIILFFTDDSSQAAGVVSNPDGVFSINNIVPGNYYLELSFLGFHKKVISDIDLNRGKTTDIGTIILSPKTFEIDDVVVESQRAAVTYEIDKKVINVSEQLTSTSGSAVDILENVPSVTVDIEGNVALRGSGNFTVLVDGKPTILDPAEILEQIPAGSVESIEIITNPSAKYDPEGTAGIMNLILKKNKRGGLSSLFELNGGLKERYGGQVMIDYRTRMLSMTFGAEYGYRKGFADQRDINRTVYEGILSNRTTEGKRNRSRERLGLRGEIGLDLSDKDFLRVGGRYRDRSSKGSSELSFAEWYDDQSSVNYYNSFSDRYRGGDQYSLNAGYEHQFQGKSNTLKVEIQYESDEGDEESSNLLYDSGMNVTEGQKNSERGPGTEFNAKLDYLYNPDDNFKFEAGYKNELDNSEESTGLYYYNISSGLYEIQDQYSNFVDYKRNEHALYSTIGGKNGGFGYQAGFRAEYTDREIKTLADNQNFKIDRWDFFPTFHLSWQITDGHQIMASYTRRINRPRGWYLEPFETWMDAYNVRKGNPGLRPEYTNSWEFGYQALLGKTIFSAETYYRDEHNTIERLRSVYADNVTLHSLDNVGTSSSLGAELMLNFDVLKDWNSNLMGNIFDYNIKGKIFDSPFERNSFNWNLRFNNIINLSATTKVQLNAIYNSPSVSSQGKREEFYMINLAVKYEIIKGMLSATLQFRDILDNAKYEYTAESAGYYSYSFRKREYPQIRLNFRFSFNRNERRDEDAGGRNETGGDEDWSGQ